MQAKRSSDRKLNMLRGLILGSILLLLVFLAYWLKSRYSSERDALQKELSAKLIATQQAISDSLVMRQMFGPPLKIPNVKRPPSGHASGSPQQFVIHFKTSDTATRLPPPLNNEHLKVKGVTKEVTYTSKGDTPDKVLIRSFGSMLEKTGLFSDSMHVLLSVGDTALIRRAFQKNLLVEGRSFSVYAGKDSATIGKQILVLNVHPHTKMLVAGFQPYLFRKITPDMLFALLLLSVTSGAFWLTIRTLRQQMRLSLIRNELVSNMSHELKTPVATVKVALEALSDEAVRTDTRTLRDYVGIASLEISRLELLINKTLHTSLLEEGRLLMQMQTVDVLQLLEELTSTIKVRFTQQSASIIAQTYGRNFTAQADKLHLQGVLLNVLDNSLKYGGSGVAVQIMLMEKPADIEITVSDNGPGIPLAYLDQVFDKFFRVPASNLHNVKGYGLGLNYASQVMQQHSGSIRVVNNADAGCSFIISLPKSASREA